MENRFPMDKFILANGMRKQRLKKAMVFKFGQMDLNMKGSGIKIWHVDMEGSYWLMEMYIKVTGLMIKHMGKVSISMPKEQLTKADGTKINKKV